MPQRVILQPPQVQTVTAMQIYFLTRAIWQMLQLWQEIKEEKKQRSSRCQQMAD
nr:MAG TPA: hypothetical protein [Caudoviricetes sp.]